MTLTGLLSEFDAVGIRIQPLAARDRLDLDWPASVVLATETCDAIRENKPTLLAYAARNAKCDWPEFWQIRWGLIAELLEITGRYRFPESEVEAFCRCKAEMDTAPEVEAQVEVERHSEEIYLVTDLRFDLPIPGVPAPFQSSFPAFEMTIP